MAVKPRTVADVRWNDRALLLFLLIFALGYYWVAEPAPLQPVAEHGAYNQLTDAILAGQTSLLAIPATELIALPDPYDPDANATYRLHDMSLYKGKWYMYFGITPVLTLFAPWRLLTGHSFPDHLGVAVFALGALFAGVQLLRRLMILFFPDTGAKPFYFFSCVLGLSNVMPFLLHRPQFYEIAIACGQCFALLAMWAVAHLLATPSAGRLAPLAGLSFGLAVGARPQLLLAGLWLLILLAMPAAPSPRRRWRTALSAAIPFGLVLIALAVYNYVRFDSPFEFGNHYQLAAVNVRKIGPFRLSSLFTSLYFTLISPLTLADTFPFVFGTSGAPFRLPMGYGLEAIAGIVWTLPYVLALFTLPALLRRLPVKIRGPLRMTVILLAVVAALLLVVDGAVGATMRYCADWSSFAFIASVLVITGWLHLKRSALLRVAVFALGIWTAVVGAALAYNGYYGAA